MLCSWVYWQLLLGWVLLLGQPVCGAEERSPDLGPSEQTDKGPEERANDTLRSTMEGENDVQSIIDMAVDYHNRFAHENLQKSMDDTTVTYMKAIGNIVEFHVYLAKTSCTNEDIENHSYSSLRMLDETERQALRDTKRCDLPPPSEQENLDCKFAAVLEQNYGWEAMVSHTCKPVQMFQEEW